MATKKGMLVVIEGSDGTGKATQSRLLLNRLRKAGVSAVRIAFPGYHRSFFGRMVASYLRGEFGAALDPRMAAVLYAGDRFEVREKITRWLEEGKVVVSDRYVDSNKAHQAARLQSSAAQKEFLRWIDRLEYGVFGMPRPDFTIFLDVPREEASRLIDRKPQRAYLRGKKRDVHEADQNHLASAQRVYQELAARRSKRHGARIVCVEQGQLLSKTKVAEAVWEALQERITRT